MGYNTDYNVGWDAGYRAASGGDYPLTTEASLKARVAELEDLLDITKRRLRESHDREDTLRREFDILDGACDFWKETAIQLGYEE